MDELHKVLGWGLIDDQPVSRCLFGVLRKANHKSHMARTLDCNWTRQNLLPRTGRVLRITTDAMLRLLSTPFVTTVREAKREDGRLSVCPISSYQLHYDFMSPSPRLDKYLKLIQKDPELLNKDVRHRVSTALRGVFASQVQDIVIRRVVEM